MSCQEMREQMHLYLDDELEERERVRFEGHIADCPDCLRDLQGLGVAIQQLLRLEWVQAPVDFTEQIMAQIAEQKGTIPMARRLRKRVIRYATLAAAAVLVFGIGVKMSAPSHFALQTKHPSQLALQGNQVIVPPGQQYNGDINVQNGDVIVKGKVNGNVTAVNGRVYRVAGANISGNTAEVDETLGEIFYYVKQMWHGITGTAP